MGLFTQRPEEPSEWAGLPSEPARPESAAERLGDGVPSGLGLDGLLDDAPGSLSSISIAVEAAAGDPDDVAAEPDQGDPAR